MTDQATIETGWGGRPNSVAGALPLWAYCLLLVFASRLALFGLGAAARAQHGLPAGWSDVWMQWDASWYLDIAANGYSQSPLLSGPMIGAGNLAFFPGYPMLLRAVALFGAPGPILASLLSTGCLLLATVLVHRTAEERYGGGAGSWASAMLVVVPGSFVFTSAMTESLYLLVTAAGFYFAHRGSVGTATAAAALAGVTRPLGALVAPCVALDELLRSRCRTPGPPSWRRVAVLATAPMLLLVFMGYLLLRFEDGFAFMSIETLWWHEFRSPLTVLAEGFSSGSVFNVAVTIAGLAGLALVLAGARWLSFGELAFATANLVVPLCSSSISMPRYAIAQFPIYLLLGLAASRSRLIRLVLVPAFALANAVLMWGWSLGRPIFI